ncbi:MAG: CoA protein activase, partial [Actinobacteria bacterium]|nr:CoA protein activase [Actinomycetota bacterium]
WNKVKVLDEVERVLPKVRVRELVRGSAEKAYKRAHTWIDQAQTIEEIQEAGRRGAEALRAVPQDVQMRPLKIGVVGEIYVVLEPASNFDMEKVLGEMGVEVHRSIFLTGWTEDNAIKESSGHDVVSAAAPYLPEMIGGHGQDTVGHTVMYAEQGYDGVIQLAPFTCIPEIVAKSILPTIAEEHGIPVLSFFLDEQTGEAGVKTRLEAFVDLLARRRALKEEAIGEGAVGR